MTTLALRRSARFKLGELLDRQRLLGLYGITLLTLAVPVLTMPMLDPRLLETGISPWVKPAKFLVSIGVFALTTAWFYGYVRLERRRAPAMRWTARLLVVAGSFELFWIVWQAAHGVDSHFNTGTLLNGVMFGLMGVFALLLTGTMLPLAWEIGWRPAPGLTVDYAAAIVAALVLAWLFGTLAGAIISVNGSALIGKAGTRLLWFGWNRGGGDLRTAHFFGLHAQQVIPLGAALLAGVAPPLRQRLTLAGVLGYAALCAGVLAQALAGRPLLPG